jgi:TRAP-type C4-dicarboxylate transport system permease small subunit
LKSWHLANKFSENMLSADTLLKRVIIVLQAFILIEVNVSVFARYVLNRPLHSSEELPTITMIWASFLAAYIASREGSHIRITIFVEKANPLLSKWLTFLSHILVIGFLVIVTWFGIEFCVAVSSYPTPVLQISHAFVYSAIPACTFLMTIDYVQKMISNLKH